MPRNTVRDAADPHPDVRKAAVIALAALPSALPIQDALRTAATDSHADVRAFARRALLAPAGQ